MSAEGEQHNRTYVLDAENAAEMARLRKQHELVTRNMGGLLAEQSDLSAIHDVLDVACGPGGWVLELASIYPNMQIMGIDVTRTMIEFARSLALEQGLNNAHFRQMNVLEPLDFSADSFDLVNARFMFGFMRPQSWSPVVREFMRVARPGAILRLTEPELGITNEPAVEELSYLFNRSLVESGQSFSPDGRHVCITPMLSSLLREAGCKNVQIRAHVTEFSANTPDHVDALQDVVVLLKLIQPYLVRIGLVSQERADQLYQQAITGMQSPNFRGLNYYLTAWGQV